MTDATPEDVKVEEVEDQLGRPDPEEYDAEGDAPVSGETGTVYDGPEGDRQAAATPHDAEATADPDADE